MDISTEVQEAIRKNLPSAVGEELRAVLEQADKDKKALAEANERLKAVTEDREQQSRRVADLHNELAKHTALKEREDKVAAAERRLELESLKVQLAAEQKYGAAIAEALKGLVRNTEFRQSSYGNVPVVTQSSPGFQSVSTIPTSSGSTSEAQ